MNARKMCVHPHAFKTDCKIVFFEALVNILLLKKKQVRLILLGDYLKGLFACEYPGWQ